jgi:3-oxoacyl-[acyl-carrier protein] reductase
MTAKSGGSAAQDAPRRVLVTGASRGIGRAIALALAADGFDVGVHYRESAAAAEEVVKAIAQAGRRAKPLRFDVADREAAAVALAGDLAADGPYWGVVCNAGLRADAAFPALSARDWDRVLRTNLDGFYNVLHPLAMPMIRRRAPGRIVCIASVSGLIGNRGQVNYSASKAGVIGAAKALAVELAKRRITVNCVAPGLIDTDMLDDDVPVEEILKAIPAQRMGTPEDVAAAVEFLVGPDAGYITRQVLAVNGGLC